MTPERVIGLGLIMVTILLHWDALPFEGYGINLLLLIGIFLLEQHPYLALILTVIALSPLGFLSIPANPMVLSSLIVVGYWFRRSLLGAWWLAAGWVAMMLLLSWRQAGHVDLSDIVVSIAAVAGATAVGKLSHRRYVAQERQLQEHSEALRAVRVIMASELHDTVAQTQSLVVMRIEDLLEDTPLPEPVRAEWTEVLALTRRAAAELRTALGTLRSMDDRFASLGLPATMSFMETWKHTLDALHEGGFDVDSRLEFVPGQCDPAREHALARIIGELAGNVIWHGSPGPCVLHVLVEDQDAVVHVVNDVGSRATRRSKSGVGLLGVQERVRLLQGTSAFRKEGSTWVADVRMPLSPLSL